ncbi:UNVERIFIED_CONTAM: hypothetical protein Slati_2398300 [Sesamum latifolium]|uniref:CCHC-type domain-containing protein n=1 Tax=Sesamum latifolium TaxID=2727402 RepID=A0AAW2WBZ1_9LAMI
MDDVPSIMLRMKEVYAVPYRHIRYVAIKAFFETKMAEGSSVQSYGVKMLSLVEKLEDLKVGLDNNMYIDVILQSFPPSYDPFIINYNMNGLEKTIHELINILVQYEATIHKSAPAVLIREASTSKAKSKRAGCWNRKKGKGKAITATASTEGAPAAPKGKGKGKVVGSQRSKANDVCMHCQEKRHWKRECPQLLSNPGMLVIEVNMITNVASWVLDAGCGAHICNNLQVLERSRRLSKDEMILRKLFFAYIMSSSSDESVRFVEKNNPGDDPSETTSRIAGSQSAGPSSGRRRSLRRLATTYRRLIDEEEEEIEGEASSPGEEERVAPGPLPVRPHSSAHLGPSSLRTSHIIHMREEFFIPDAQVIYTPGPQASAHSPPVNCLSFFLAQVRAVDIMFKKYFRDQSEKEKGGNTPPPSRGASAPSASKGKRAMSPPGECLLRGLQRGPGLVRQGPRP